MMKRTYLFFLVLLVYITDQQDLSAQQKEGAQTLSLLFIGDVMQHQSQINAAYDAKSDTYEYNSTFQYVKPIIASADYSIANLEVTFGGKPYTGYPQFSSPEALGHALQSAGVDCLVTANNHSCDRRKTGIYSTIDFLDNIDMSHTGTFINAKTRKLHYPLLIEKNGFRIALLNYTYGTNGIPAPEPSIVNLLDKELIMQDLKAAKGMKPDKIIAFVHWGKEYESYPNDYQTGLADFFVENGADFVIGSHPHVLQRMENYYDKERKKDIVKVYSLGNFVSNQRTRKRDGGAMVKIVLEKNKEEVQLKQMGYYLTWVYTPTIEGRKYWYIVPASEYEGKQAFFKPTSYEKMKVFIDDSRKLMEEENINAIEYTYDSVNSVWGFGK